MKTNNHNCASTGKQFGRCADEGWDSTELVVYENPQCLECLGCWVDAVISVRRCPFGNHLSQLLSAAQRPGLDNCSSNLAGKRLFSKSIDQVGQIPFSIMVHYFVSSHRMLPVHAHVQRTVVLKAKASFRRVQLKGGDSQVNEYTVTTFNASLSQDLRELREIAMHQFVAPFVGRQSFRHMSERFPILVNTEQQAFR